MADEDLGTAYSGQQEDINDKLLLDLAWERQQKKVSPRVVGKLKKKKKKEPLAVREGVLLDYTNPIFVLVVITWAACIQRLAS